MRQRRTWIIILTLALVLAGVAVGRVRSRTGAGARPAPAAEAVPVEVARVTNGTIERSIELSGSITARRLAKIYPRRSGQVARLLVNDGDRVAAGQALVVLDAGEIQTRVRQAEAAVRAAEAHAALLRAGAQPEQIAQAEETVRQARAQVAAAEARLRAMESGARPQERRLAEDVVRQAEAALATARSQLEHARLTLQTAEDNLQRMEVLLREGAVSQMQLDQARWETDRARTALRAAEHQVRAAETQVHSAQQQLSLVQSGPRPEELDLARAQVEQARAVARQAELQLTLLRRGARPEELRAVDAQRDQARGLLAEARQALAETVIRAPFAGRVARLKVSPGDFVQSGEFGAGGPVAIVYDPSALEAEVTIGEREAAIVRPGQPAILRPEAMQGVSLRGTVKTVTPLAEPGSRAVTVRLRIEGLHEDILPGTFVRGTVVVEHRAGILTVPRAALRDEGVNTLWVVARTACPTGTAAGSECGTVDQRTVGIGLIEGERVEVRSGVRAGEWVVVLGPDTLTGGARVLIVRRRR